MEEKWTNNVFEVHRVSDRILVLRLVLGESVFTFVSVYAPQVGGPNEKKTMFYDELQKCISKVPSSEILTHWVTGMSMLVRKLMVLRTCMAVLVMASVTLKVSGFEIPQWPTIFSSTTLVL